MAGTPENETVTPIILSTSEEQLAYFKGLQVLLRIQSRDEVEGGDLLNETEGFRELFVQAVSSLDKGRSLTPVDWLVLGITEKVPEEKLTRWLSKPPTEEIGRFARFFLEKREQDN